MKLSGNKKIILLGIILLVVAGIIVVALKGYNVALLYRQHEEISIPIGKEVDINEINGFCSEVFKNKKFIVRNVELFNDSVCISAETITNDEGSELLNKINEKYGTNFGLNEGSERIIKIYKNPNIRIRDLVRPYVKPVISCSIVIVCYLYLRYIKHNPLKFLGKSFIILVITELIIASVIAIVRIPVSPITVNLMVAFAIFELILIISNKEKEIS